MIQINELRIGNLIQEGKIEQIDNSIDEVYYSGDGYYQSNYCCNINPILLNKEWLSKFGFEKSDKRFDYFSRTHYFLYIKKIDLTGDLVINVDEYGNIKNSYSHIKYIHQLQNLYFALTNTEL